MPCGGIEGAWNTAEVNVGYYPWMVSGKTATVHAGPSADSPVVATLTKRARFGVQSTRNPHNVDDPPSRPGRNWYVWGYCWAQGTSGWISQADIVPQIDSASDVWATGPAKADFQVGAQRSIKHGKTSSCRGVRGTRKRIIDVNDTYLRYAPHSTPWYYLVKGDVVRELWRGENNYLAIEVVESAVAPTKTRGWIPYDSLNRRVGVVARIRSFRRKGR